MPALLRSIPTSTPRAASRMGWHSAGARPGFPSVLRRLHQDHDVDKLARESIQGRTGGGEPLESSSKNAPPQPKITNQSVPGLNGTDKLTEEQQREVDQHNEEFEAKHDRGHKAPSDKVDKKFWGDDAQQ